MATNIENPNKQKMIDLREQGLSYGSIAKMVGVSRSRVHQICSGYQNPTGGKNRFSSVSGYGKIHNSILVRDNFKCQWGNLCKDKEIEVKDLVVHHIDFNDRNNSTNNLITLCRFCHLHFHRSNHIDEKTLQNLNSNNNQLVIKKCKICEKEYKVSFSIKNSKFCSKECRIVASKLSPEEKEMSVIIKRKKQKDKGYKSQKSYYYKNREKVKVKMREYYQNHKKKLSPLTDV